jgi:hypothetical protein
VEAIAVGTLAAEDTIIIMGEEGCSAAIVEGDIVVAIVAEEGQGDIAVVIVVEGEEEDIVVEEEVEEVEEVEGVEEEGDPRKSCGLGGDMTTTCLSRDGQWEGVLACYEVI